MSEEEGYGLTLVEWKTRRGRSPGDPIPEKWDLVDQGADEDPNLGKADFVDQNAEGDPNLEESDSVDQKAEGGAQTGKTGFC